MFKVGDTVIHNAITGSKLIRHCQGTVILEDEASETCLIAFDVDVGGHNGEGHGRDGHCWWCLTSYLELAVITLENE